MARCVCDPACGARKGGVAAGATNGWEHTAPGVATHDDAFSVLVRHALRIVIRLEVIVTVGRSHVTLTRAGGTGGNTAGSGANGAT